jgi:hypothetical protein
MQQHSRYRRCSAGKITGPLPWEDAEEVGSPGSVRSPGLVQLLAPRHPHQQPAEADPHSAADAPLQENGTADWTAGPPAPDACAQNWDKHPLILCGSSGSQWHLR